MSINRSVFTPSPWLRLGGHVGGHVQTLWSALGAAKPQVTYRRERWATPDQDFIDLDWLHGPTHEQASSAPLLVLFHGLEGSSRSHYALAFAGWAAQHHWRLVVPHFRGCSGELNRGPRAYHCGDFEEIDWILQRLRAQHAGPMWAVGASLGGSALLRWAQEAGHSANQVLNALCAVSVPLDLTASGQAMCRGFNRQVYTRIFLRTMVPKALQKAAQYPERLNAQTIAQARDLFEFDEHFTAPLHGFAGAADYWQRAASKPHLHRLQVPTLLINARNDPFVPASSLPSAQQVSDQVVLWQPAHGGHVGFTQGPWPGDLSHWTNQVMAWLCGVL